MHDQKVSKCQGTQSVVPCPKGRVIPLRGASPQGKHVSGLKTNDSSAPEAYVGCTLAAEICTKRHLMAFVTKENLFCYNFLGIKVARQRRMTLPLPSFAAYQKPLLATWRILFQHGVYLVGLGALDEKLQHVHTTPNHF